MFRQGSNSKSLREEHAALRDKLTALKVKAESSREGVRSQLETLTQELAAHNDLIGKLNG